jgi:hypothetical protein
MYDVRIPDIPDLLLGLHSTAEVVLWGYNEIFSHWFNGMYCVYSINYLLHIRRTDTGHDVVKAEYIKSMGSWVYSFCLHC